MKITELEQPERIALGGLLRLMIRSDGDFTVAEEDTVNKLGEKHLGSPGDMWSLISASAQACPRDAAIREAAKAVSRPQAREAILELVREVAAGDEVSSEEAALLVWLESIWK